MLRDVSQQLAIAHVRTALLGKFRFSRVMRPLAHCRLSVTLSGRRRAPGLVRGGTVFSVTLAVVASSLAICFSTSVCCVARACTSLWYRFDCICFPAIDRKNVVEGNGGSVRVHLVGG